jgi:hypothetical protein
MSLFIYIIVFIYLKEVLQLRLGKFGIFGQKITSRILDITLIFRHYLQHHFQFVVYPQLLPIRDTEFLRIANFLHHMIQYGAAQ